MREFKRLTEKHPVYQKLEQVFQLMDTLGITIEVGRYGDMVVTDVNHSTEFLLCDLEAHPDHSPSITSLPPSLEWKVCTEQKDG